MAFKLRGSIHDVYVFFIQEPPDQLMGLSQAIIAERCDLSKITVYRSIKSLEALGLIEVKRICNGIENSYILPYGRKD